MAWLKWATVTFMLLIPGVTLIIIAHAGLTLNVRVGQWGSKKLKKLINFKNKIAPMPKCKPQ